MCKIPMNLHSNENTIEENEENDQLRQNGG